MSDIEETPADVGEVEQVEETGAAPAAAAGMSIEDALQEVSTSGDIYIVLAESLPSVC